MPLGEVRKADKINNGINVLAVAMFAFSIFMFGMMLFFIKMRKRVICTLKRKRTMKKYRREIEEEKYWPLYLGNLWLFGHSTP